MEAFVEVCVEVSSLEAFISSTISMKSFVEAFVGASMQVVAGQTSKTSAKAFNNSIKASMEAFVVVKCMEAFVNAFVDAGVEVTFVEAFKSSISFMEAFVDAFVEASVDVDFVKASKTSAKAYITSRKALVGAFVDVTSMEAFVESCCGSFRGGHFRGRFHIFQIFHGSFRGSWKLPCKMLRGKL